MKKILIIGRNGQVTTYLQRHLKGDYKVIVAGREQLDLLQTETIQERLDSLNPDLIINPAAYTAVDLAEENTEQADIINHLAVAEIARYSEQMSVPLIHFSTDYVFSGDALIPYVETDEVAPAGVYGMSKYAGEQAILNSGAPALILRTSWVYSNQGKNFYKTMVGLAETRNELNVVADQTGSPTYAGSIAQTTGQLLDLILAQGKIKQEQVGVYHFTCKGKTSWCDFARAIFKCHAIDNMQVNAITTDEYPTPAKRPAYSVLDNAKLQEVFGLSLPHWEKGLDDCIKEVT